MKYFLLIFALTFISDISIGQEKGQYEIIGLAKGFTDSTILYLSYTDEKRDVRDSAYVVEEKFFFKGQLKSKVVNALINTRGYSDYKFFWLENSKIVLTGEKAKFRGAIIRGSKTQEDQNELDVLLEATSEEKRKEQSQFFVRKHPSSIISAHLLKVYGSTWGKETTQLLYNGLTSEMKNTSYGKEVSEFITFNQNLRIGDKYADFSQEDTKNRLVKLSDFDGKIILLEFWGSWCGPCRRANPELVKIYNEFKDKGFEILGVAAESNKDAWLKAVEEDQLPWTNVTDLKGDRNRAVLVYGVSYFPTNFLIDGTGTIISRDLDANKLRERLTSLLNLK